MITQVANGPAILIGYGYRLQIETEVPLFPEGADLVAQVRQKPSAADILATLTSAEGHLLREGDHLLTLTIPAAFTTDLSVGSVVLDLVRLDVTPALPLGFILEIPVMLPVTRGLP